MKIKVRQIKRYEKCRKCNYECSVYFKLDGWDKKDWLCGDCFAQDLLNGNYFIETENYKKGFDIFYEYYDSISDEEKPKVDKMLKRLNL